mmetsp:Transcript_4481/g.12619  ORF Transcript_4481/g.12619 Transcript_4481/m.12619 type:complete len:285 (+) Transcript_4481:5272-6126(+)
MGLKCSCVAILRSIESFSDDVGIAHNCPKRSNIWMFFPLDIPQIFHRICIAIESLVVIVLLHVHRATVLQSPSKTDLALSLLLMRALAYSFCNSFIRFVRQKKPVYAKGLGIQLQSSIDVVPISLECRGHIDKHIGNTNIVAADVLAPAEECVLVTRHGRVKIAIEVVQPPERMQHRKHSGMAIRTLVVFALLLGIRISVPLCQYIQRFFAVIDGIVELSSPPMERRQAQEGAGNVIPNVNLCPCFAAAIAIAVAIHSPAALDVATGLRRSRVVHNAHGILDGP